MCWCMYSTLVGMHLLRYPPSTLFYRTKGGYELPEDLDLGAKEDVWSCISMSTLFVILSFIIDLQILRFLP